MKQVVLFQWAKPPVRDISILTIKNKQATVQKARRTIRNNLDWRLGR